jgi:hypothetical protein
MNARRANDHAWNVYMALVIIMLAAGYFAISPEKLYKPGDDIGYNIGLIGGIMLLTLLFYPLRKRVMFMSHFGPLPVWFRWHMIFGILGPALIVLHSTYHIRSTNAAVAMYCMLVVAGSGMFGRFFYTKIHRGLYGRQATVNDLKTELEESAEVSSIFQFAPNIEKALDDFRNDAEKRAQSSRLGLVNFIRASFKAGVLDRYQARELRHIMQARATDGSLTGTQRRDAELLFDGYRLQISAYIRAIRDAAQFNTYERMFSWWHVLHIPLVYMLAFSAIYHVYAVHAY